mmetsp:Transcript_21384/g.64126  ORF Transcript_21384/g.64126 Transcript_21384/m.64126 type:complete len:336 (+) Transcript_21384:533-1540(+)
MPNGDSVARDPQWVCCCSCSCDGWRHLMCEPPVLHLLQAHLLLVSIVIQHHVLPVGRVESDDGALVEDAIILPQHLHSPTQVPPLLRVDIHGAPAVLCAAHTPERRSQLCHSAVVLKEVVVRQLLARGDVATCKDGNARLASRRIMPLLSLAVGVAAAVQQPCLVATVARIDEQTIVQLHDVEVLLADGPRVRHARVQLLAVQHLADVLHDKRAARDELHRTHAVPAVLREERLDARHLQQVERLVATLLTARARARVAVHERLAVEAPGLAASVPRDRGLQPLRIMLRVGRHAVADRHVVLVLPAGSPLRQPHAALDVLVLRWPYVEPFPRRNK